MVTLFPLIGLLLLQCVQSLNNAAVPGREFSTAWISFSAEEEAERRLQLTGDVWKACSGNNTEGKQIVQQDPEEYGKKVYQHTSYDDGHQPACTCFYDKSRLEYWAQCAVGDKTCNEATGACTGTHEFFLFSDVSGDLKQKSSCNLCTDVTNCEGIQETCTLVVFGDTGEPVKCVLKSINEDGSQTLCDSCTICKDGMTGQYGVSYSNCFGESTPTGTCDTSGTAHLHNFQPVPKPGTSPIGGSFGNLCQKDEEKALYRRTTYDDKFKKTCDCQDPTQGVVACDLFIITSTSDCYANQCTELSEEFFFNSKGDLEEKMTCDLTNDLCSIVKFSDAGEPVECSMFSPEKLETCDKCTICKDQTLQNYGIRYNCFGVTVGPTTCLTDNGRAVFNLELETPPSVPSNDRKEPPSSGEQKPPQTTSASNRASGSGNTDRALLLGILFGGIAVAAALTLLVSMFTKTRENAASAETPPSEPEKADETGGTTAMDEPPTALVDQSGQPMIEDPTPIVIS